jgi:hypothetical protein
MGGFETRLYANRDPCAQIDKRVGAGFKPALVRQSPLARYFPGPPPTAQHYSRCKRECDLALSHCE